MNLDDKYCLIDDCFAELIRKRGWYKKTHTDRRLAAFHKKQFLNNELADEKKREYLKNGGYILVQPEKWKKLDSPKTDKV